MATATVLAAFSAASFAQTDDQSTDAKHKQVNNVEELLDNVARYDGKKVQVCGKIEEIEAHTFILESGGIFNDEIIVVMPKGKEIALQFINSDGGLALIEEDSNVIVTGTVRTVGAVEIEREYGLDLDPEIEIELERVKAFLIADRIERKDSC
jgi:hypothetical protein